MRVSRIAGTSIFVFGAVLAMFSISITNSAAASATSRKMNFSQISHGNYKSLRGRWVEAANGTDAFGYGGLRRGGGDTLAVSDDRIVNAPLVVRNGRLTDGQGLKNARLVFDHSDKHLSAELADQSVAVNYSLTFYPRGASMRLAVTTNGIKIPTSKNRIVIWTSNNGYNEVFVER